MGNTEIRISANRVVRKSGEGKLDWIDDVVVTNLEKLRFGMRECTDAKLMSSFNFVPRKNYN